MMISLYTYIFGGLLMAGFLGYNQTSTARWYTDLLMSLFWPLALTVFLFIYYSIKRIEKLGKVRLK